MKRLDKALIIGTIVCLLPIALGLLLYGHLPDQIPIHWNSAGEVDNTASKATAVFLMPAGLALLHLLIQFLIRYDPKRANASPVVRAVSMWVVPVISIVCFTVSYLVGIGLDVPFLLSLFIGFLILILGNYLPRCKQSYTIGIRLPWTLRDADNWNKTHRFGGRVWVMCGLGLMIAAFFQIWFLQVILIILLLVLPCIYSFLLYQKNKKGS